MERTTHRATELITGAGAGNLGIMSLKITSDGTPDPVVFRDHGLPDMADDQYRIFLAGETVAALKPDESTIATTGFSVIGGGNTEVIHVMVHGKIAGMPAV
jgi:hypothetical protein